MSHDVFICHASEDKDALVRPLAEALRERNVDVWYDEFSLRIGDSLRQSIDRGLVASRYGVVVLSPAFFDKAWTQWELDGLVTKLTAERRKVILPIWHGLGADDVGRYSPPMAGMVAVLSTVGVPSICDQLLQVIRPSGAPLETAKQTLLDFGWDPPPISDPWWIDMIALESDIDSPYGPRRPWLFPHPPVGPADDRGARIAWTVMQNGWNYDAGELGICQITRPEAVFEFIDADAALADAAEAHPDVVANYAPQLLIPEFSGRFARAFDRLLAASEAEIREEPDSRYPNATCEKAIALRAPDFGGHRAEDVADKWMNGNGGDRTAAHHSTTDYAFWLLSDNSQWLPASIRRMLTEGMRDYGRWPMDLNYSDFWGKDLSDAFYAKRRTPFNWTRARHQALQDVAAGSLARLGIQGDPVPIATAFIEYDFVGEIDRRVKEGRGRW